MNVGVHTIGFVTKFGKASSWVSFPRPKMQVSFLSALTARLHRLGLVSKHQVQHVGPRASLKSLEALGRTMTRDILVFRMQLKALHLIQLTEPTCDALYSLPGYQHSRTDTSSS